MSTSYYRLRPPITYLNLEQREGHDILEIWVNDALAGQLALRGDETTKILDCFTLFEGDDKCPLRSYWGGDNRGCVVYSNEPSLPDDALVISEYHELLTVREVKAKNGKGKKDERETQGQVEATVQSNTHSPERP